MTIGQKGGQGRGLCHIEDCNKPTLVDVVGDTDMLSSVPPKSAKGHPFLEQSNPVNSLEVTPTANSSTSIRRPRGKNMNKRLNYMVDKYGPITLEFEDECQVPVGENASLWSRMISTIVYNYCDLHYDCWTKVPAEVKHRLEERVVDKFELNLALEKNQEIIRHALGRSYGRTRTNLHLHYKIHFKDVCSNDLAAVANAKAKARDNVPKGLLLEQWLAICESFETDSWKKKSARNKKNRACLKTNHTAGTSTFVNIIHKKTKINNVKPKPIEFYKDTHMRKNGTFVNEVVEKLYNEMESRANSENVNTSQEDIVSQVIVGHRLGHVSGMGCGAIPTRSSSSCARYAAQLDNHNECRIKQLETEKKLEDSLERQAKMAESQAAMQAECATLRAQMDMILQKLGGPGGSSFECQSSKGNI